MRAFPFPSPLPVAKKGVAIDRSSRHDRALSSRAHQTGWHHAALHAGRRPWFARLIRSDFSMFPNISPLRLWRLHEAGASHRHSLLHTRLVNPQNPIPQPRHHSRPRPRSAALICWLVPHPATRESHPSYPQERAASFKAVNITSECMTPSILHPYPAERLQLTCPS